MRQTFSAILMCCLGGSVVAGDSAPRLNIELNAAQSQGAACTLSFVVQNDLAAGIAQMTYETVLFDTAGQVIQLSLFDFGALPQGRPRVRQFVLDQTDCADLGRILFNGANTCTAPDLADGICESALTLSTRTKIEVLG